MRIVVGRLIVSKSAQRFDDCVLCLGLAGVDDVIDLGNVAEVRMIFLAFGGGNPAIVSIGIAVELAIAEIAPQQAKFPHVIGNVFAYVAYGTVGTDDDFLIVSGNRVRCRGDPWFRGGDAGRRSRSIRRWLQCRCWHLRWREGFRGGLANVLYPARTSARRGRRDPNSSSRSEVDAPELRFQRATFSRCA